jgi:hypothetical protein
MKLFNRFRAWSKTPLDRTQYPDYFTNGVYLLILLLALFGTFIVGIISMSRKGM